MKKGSDGRRQMEGGGGGREQGREYVYGEGV